MQPKLQRWVQRQGWDRAASCYERYWGDQLRPAIELLLATAELRPGERVLDVAAGTGAVSLEAAAAVAPAGHVLATDLSSKMLDELGRRAAAHRRDNIDVACCGAEDLDDLEVLGVGDSFDVALCSLGLMYVPSPRAAADALHRSLRPGGRTVVSVWGDRRHCGWAEIFPIVDARVTSDVCPMFFALGNPGALTTLLEGAGFVDIHEERLAVELRYAHADEALGAAFLGGPVALAASRFSADDRAAAHAEYLASIEGFADGTGYRIPGEFVVASARRTEIPTLAVHPSTSTTN
jgi:ubiquinone/menaquinone biosynthesis C-methylase UbiE